MTWIMQGGVMHVDLQVKGALPHDMGAPSEAPLEKPLNPPLTLSTVTTNVTLNLTPTLPLTLTILGPASLALPLFLQPSLLLT